MLGAISWPNRMSKLVGVAMNGGVAGIAQKNRTEASWLHANIHAQGNQ